METTLAPLSAADIDAIAATTQVFARSLVGRDFDTLLSLYAEDAVFMPPHHPAVHGRAALKTWLAAFPTVTLIDVRTDRIDGRGDLAYVRGSYTMSVTPGDGQQTISDAGKFLEIRQKQADGSWLLVTDMFNSDNP
jgi:uncharacterized protein (TIGR02246 family)